MQPLPRIDDQPVPLRMLNEFTYCPRLGYLEWVQGEWADSHDTLHGEFIHRNVDREDKKAIPEAEELGEDSLHARSLRLENAELGLVALVDVLELDGGIATPVDYKRGSVPDNAEHSWEPERVQICAQGLLLRAAGYNCSEGILYYSASKRRIPIPFDEPLVRRTRDLIAEFRRVAQTGQIPPPLVDSPKCPRCSLVGICLFQCALSRSEYVVLQSDLWEILNLDEDRVVLVDLGPQVGRGSLAMESWGRALMDPVEPGAPMII